VTILIDAYAVVALVRDEPAADDVEALLGQSDVAVVSINLAEALDVLQRRDGVEESFLRTILDPLFRMFLTVRPVGSRAAWRAAALRKMYYAKKQSEVSLADCVLVAAARSADVIATSDIPLLQMATGEGVATIELPASA